jgi:hypothetical protein
MDAITALVAELRDEAPPTDRLDPRAAGLPETGKADVHYDDPDRRSS